VSLEAAFLLLVSKNGRGLSSREVRYAHDDKGSLLHFAPGDHMFWSNRASTVALGAWQQPCDKTRSHWRVDEFGITMITGYVRFRGVQWAAEATSVERLAASIGSESLPHVADDLVGVFTAVSLRSDGEGAVLTDPLGLRFVYCGENDHVFVASSQAELVARTLTKPGDRPARDVVGTCSLAYSRYRIGHNTGFEGIHLLAAGSRIVVGPNSEPSVVERPAPWMPSEALRQLHPAELVDRARSEIAESISSFLDLPGERHVVDLSGGKDSRLILALLVSEGLASSVQFQTTGPQDLVDVRIAAELAQKFGLDHTVEFPTAPPEKSYGDRLREFVSATVGMTNVWHLQPIGAVDQTVHLNGTNGECLRAHQPVRKVPLHQKDDLIRFFDQEMPYGQLQLVRPDIAGELREMALAALLDDPLGGSHPVDLLDGFHFRNSARQHFGPKEQLNPALRVLPLYALEALRAAFALGPTARHSELIHFEIIRRCSASLANHPFAGPGWNDAPSAAAAEPARHPTEPPTSPPSAQTPKAEPVVARMRRTAFDRHKATLLEVLSDAGTSAWEVIDRSKAAEALERFHSLSNPARVELYGAITAALWLGMD
jgi:hypothetical protein